MYDTSELMTEHSNPTLLKPGTLVHLWAPGDRPWYDGNRPTTARVERVTATAIVGTDLADGSGGQWDVSTDPTNPARLSWTWEVFAPPQRSAVIDGVEVVIASADIEERTRLIAGEPNDELRVSLRNGEQVHGRLTKLVMGRDEWEAEWAELVDAPPGRQTAVHAVRVADVSKITRYRDA